MKRSYLAVLSLLAAIITLSLAGTSDFLIIGDYGQPEGMGKGKLEKVTKAMDAEAGRYDYDRIVTAGDNIYYEGIKDINNPD